MMLQRGRVNASAFSSARFTWIWIAFVAVLAAALPAQQAGAQVRFVRANAPAGGNGLTWATAFNDLQAALAAAAANPAITQLWLASGVYKPAGAGGSRTATFQLRNNLALYGGFSGSETLLSQRNIAANVTTLSGDLNNNDEVPTTTFPVPPWLDDNSFHVVTGSGVGASARLDGVTVRGGGAMDFMTPNNNGGGGLFCAGGSPTIETCTFTRNYALNLGAAVQLSASSNATFAFCDFSFNRVWDGRGGGNGGGATHVASSNPAFSDCTFASNLSLFSSAGGAIRSSLGTLTIQRCLFDSNVVSSGSGGAISNSGTLVISDSTFENNAVGGPGSTGGSIDTSGPSTIVNCTFRHDGVGGSAAESGGAIRLSGGPHRISKCLFDHILTGDGGAVTVGGANAAIVNCRFTGNSAGVFGGAAIWSIPTASDTLNIVNCLFSGNHCSGAGGAILFDNPGSPPNPGVGAVTMANCTFANNLCNNGSGGAVSTFEPGTVNIRNSIVVHNTPGQLAASGGGAFSVTRSMIEGGFAGTGNIASSNAGFADENGPDNLVGTPDDDLRLIASSLCIDAGSNSSVPADIADLDGDGNFAEPTPLDLALSIRFYDLATANNTGKGTPPIVDMGCYEHRPVCEGDTNNSGSVDVDDLIAVILAWGGCPNCPTNHCPADIAPFPAGNCAIDVDDLVAVILHWGACP